MTTAFQLNVVRAPGPGEPRIHLEGSQGISLGSSGDGSATVGVLGSVGQERTARALAEGYLEAGRDPVAVAAGHAGCLVIDQVAGTVAAVMPHIGLGQTYWRAVSGMLAIASSPHGLAALGGQAPKISLDALYQYVYFHMLPGPTTIFEGVSKLDGGHWLRWDGSHAELQRYWRPRFDDEPRFTEADATAELHRLLSEAVRGALESVGPAGAFLSGGLDSSTVAGLAARERPGIPTVSMGFDAQGYDEMEYARLASRHFGTTPLEYYVTPDDVLSTLPEIAQSFPEPFGNSSAAAAYHCARIARDHGLQRLLAGDGGDELFGGNERYAKQLVFERYGRVPSTLRKRLLEPSVAAAAKVTRGFPIGKAASYIEQANVPLPDRLQAYNFLHRHPPGDVFSAGLLEHAHASEPLRLLRDEYRVPTTSSPVDRMLFLDWKFTLHDNDLVKVNTMCHLAGVEVAYPMLDPAIVDFSLRVPGDWKVRHGELRWFYKRAMRDFLPREIITKTKHGFGLPFGVWTRTHDGLRRLSENALASLAERGFFRQEFLTEALRLHREGHASYYGELVWILMALELWLQRHRPTARL